MSRSKNVTSSKTRYLPSVKRCAITIQGLPEAITEDLKNYISLLKALRERASKSTHYVDLNSYTNNALNHVQEMLEKYGVINGDPEANSKNKEASFWCHVYCVFGSVINSTHLKTNVAPHHSSAYSRNEALIIELSFVLRSSPFYVREDE